MNLNKEQFLGLLRHTLSAVGVYLISNGTIDEVGFTELTGGIMTLATAIWSMYDKTTTNIMLKANELQEKMKKNAKKLA